MFPDHFPSSIQTQTVSSNRVTTNFRPFILQKRPSKRLKRRLSFISNSKTSRYTPIWAREKIILTGFWIRSDKMEMLALLDGHCDPQPTNFLQKHLLNRLSKHPKIIAETETAIAQVFEELQRQVIQQYQKGTTALVVILFQKQMVVANLGDSILYGINLQNRITQLTTIHNLTNSSELMQVISQGGIILKKGSQYRINGELNLSRSFGDRKLKYCMCSKPDIYRFERKNYKRIVLATDGFYNALQVDRRLLMEDGSELQEDSTLYMDNASAIYIDF